MIQKYGGIVLITILSAIPVVLWARLVPLAGRFDSTYDILASLGQMAGLVGMVLFALNFVLSARFSALEKVFFGLNKAYVVHHIVGGLALIFLLVHPIFLTLRYLPISLQFAATFLVGFDDLAVTIGEIALLVLMLLLSITFYAHWKHENWKLSHKFLGLALFLGGLHVFLIDSDVAADPLLRWYMLGLAILGLIVYVWRTLFSGYKLQEYVYTVAGVRRVNDAVTEVTLKPEQRVMRFAPGQFAFLRFQGGGMVNVESHPFSITAPQGSDLLQFVMKAVGDYTATLGFLNVGATARIEGPFGVFTYTRVKSRRQIWIAGGIGITPFLSMARSMQIGDGYQVDLYYSLRNANEAVFVDELQNIAQNHGGLRLIPFYSDTQGFINAEFVNSQSANLADSEIFLCGPPGFMKALRSQFVSIGVANNRVHSEEFQLS